MYVCLSFATVRLSCLHCIFQNVGLSSLFPSLFLSLSLSPSPLLGTINHSNLYYYILYMSNCNHFVQHSLSYQVSLKSFVSHLAQELTLHTRPTLTRTQAEKGKRKRTGSYVVPFFEFFYLLHQNPLLFSRF